MSTHVYGEITADTHCHHLFYIDIYSHHLFLFHANIPNSISIFLCTNATFSLKSRGFFFFGPRSKIWPLTQRHMGQSVPRACQAIALGCAPTCTISMRSVQPLCGTRRMFRTSVHTSGGVQASVR